MTMYLASNLRATPAPALTELMARVREISSKSRIINLAQAVVDFPPPEPFIEAVIESIRGDHIHRYSPDPGWLHLRQTLADYLNRSFGLNVHPENELIITPGANQACFEAFMSILEPGDEVIIPAPWYFNHAMTVTMLGGILKAVPAHSRDDYIPDPERIKDLITEKTRAFVFVNPNNPTGSCYGDDWIREVGDILADREIWVISDQTYQEIVFQGGRPLSMASLPGMHEKTVTVGSFSKSLGIAGWRIGFLAGPDMLVEQAIKVQDCSIISAPNITQSGLMATLPHLESFREKYLPVLKRRRDAFCEGIQACREIRYTEPQGSIFVFLRLPDSWDEMDFARHLLEKAGVALVPATGFGPGGKGGLRVSFGATLEKDLVVAAEKIGECVKSYK